MKRFHDADRKDRKGDVAIPGGSGERLNQEQKQDHMLTIRITLVIVAVIAVVLWLSTTSSGCCSTVSGVSQGPSSGITWSETPVRESPPPPPPPPPPKPKPKPPPPPPPPPPNVLPSAVLVATPLLGTAPMVVVFDGSCTDPDGTITACNIFFGDNSDLVNNVATPHAFTSGTPHTYTSGSIHSAKLVATDDKGGSAFSQALQIGINNPPIATLFGAIVTG